MLVAKQVADLLTGSRALLGFILAWLGLEQGADGLPLAICLLIAAWTSDIIDGPLARHSRRKYRTWIGNHDLEADMAVSAGLCVYLLGSGFISVWLGFLYIGFWGVLFLKTGILRPLGMLFQAPIYGWFTLTALHYVPSMGRWLVYWIVGAVIVTWPRFPREIVPDFLSGISELLVKYSRYVNRSG